MADGKIVISTKIDQSGFKTGAKELHSGLSSLKSSLTKLAGAVGLAFSVAAVINFGKSAVKASNELENALTGLKSVVDGMGRSFDSAKNFINEYISDGLISATEASTAYKNLLLRGYDDSQIQQVLIALKDSAAYGRQSSYTLGQAVQSATEGLKNENSILVDNAGVTKNVAKMWDDYAKSIGTTANNLTQQQKIQAEVTGILEETKFQTGDAARVANSFSGQLMQLQFAFNNLKIAVGDAIKPIATAVLPYINTLITRLTKLANLIAQISTALFSKQAQQQQAVAKTGVAGAKSQNELAKSTAKAGKAAKKVLAPFDELNVLQQNISDSANSLKDDLQESFGGGAVGGAEAPIEVSSQVQDAVQKIKELFAPFQNVDFSNAIASFGRLKEAVAPFTNTLFSGLKWFIDNVLAPLSKWVIEDVVPSFINLLAEAFGAVNAVLIALEPMWTWAWENFFKPLAMWVADKVVDTINWLTDALKRFSDWATENQDVVQIITGLILTFLAELWLYNTVKKIHTFITSALVPAFLKFAGALATMNVPLLLAGLGIAILATGIIYLAKNWSKLTPLQRAVTILSGLAAAATAAAIAIALFHTSWSVGIAAAAIAGGLALLAGTYLFKKYNGGKASLPTSGGSSLETAMAFGNKNFSTSPLPRLATGAVIPPRSEFLAILGDQRQGRNIETPESLLRQIMREELSRRAIGGTENININTDVRLEDGIIIGRASKTIQRQKKSYGLA